MANVTRFLALVVAAAVCSIAVCSTALADQHLQRLGRLFGAGWGDGYHTCRDGGCRPGADLPPANAYDQFGPKKKKTCSACQVYPADTALCNCGRAGGICDVPCETCAPATEVYPSDPMPIDLSPEPTTAEPIERVEMIDAGRAEPLPRTLTEPDTWELNPATSAPATKEHGLPDNWEQLPETDADLLSPSDVVPSPVAIPNLDSRSTLPQTQSPQFGAPQPSTWLTRRLPEPVRFGNDAPSIQANPYVSSQPKQRVATRRDPNVIYQPH